MVQRQRSLPPREEAGRRPHGGEGDALICPTSRRRGPRGPGARLWSKASPWAGGTTAFLLLGGSAVITPSELRLLCEMTLLEDSSTETLGCAFLY